MRFFFSLFLICNIALGRNNFSPKGLTAIWDTTNAAGILNGTGNWTNTSTLWTYETGAKNSPFCQGCNVSFGKAGSTGNGGTVTITGTQQINSMTFDTVAGGNYTITGGTLSCVNSSSCTYTSNVSSTISSNISGGLGLIKAGTQDLTLTADNTFTGTVDINAGTLTFSTPNFNTYRGGQININGASTMSVVQTGGVVRYDFPAMTYSFNATGGGSITTGAGLNWVQQGSWTFATNGGNRNTISGSSQINMNTFGTIFTVASGTDATSDLDISIAMGNTTQGITKNGAGTMRTSGTNTYTGTTTVNDGTLSFGNGVATGNIIPAGNLITNNASLVYNTPSTITHSGIISGTGTLTKSGSGSLTLSAVNTWTGGAIVSQGNLISSGGNSAMGTGTVTLGDANTGTNNISWRWPGGTQPPNNCVVSNQGTGTVTLGGNTGGINTASTGSYTFNRAVTINDGTGERTTLSGKISGNVGTITVSGSRVTFGNAANDFVGNISVSDGSIYQTDLGTALPTTTDINLNTSGIYRLNNGGTHVMDALNGGATSAVNIIAGGNTSLSLGNDNGSATFSGVISNNAATLSLIKNGTGTQTLSGANTFTGTISINAGTLQSTNASGLGDNAGTINMNGGNLTTSIGADTTFPKPVTWAANGTWFFTQPDFGRTWTVTGNWTVNNGITATVDGNKGTGRTNINGIISGAGGITFTGSTPITVNGNNTYTGGTTINNSSGVTCGNANALGTIGTIIVNAGAILNKNGTNCGFGRIINNGTLIP